MIRKQPRQHRIYYKKLSFWYLTAKVFIADASAAYTTPTVPALQDGQYGLMTTPTNCSNDDIRI